MNIENIRKLAVHRPCIALLRIHKYFPSDDEIIHPEKNGYLYKYILINLTTIYYSVGAFIHLINSAKNGNGLYVDVDILTIVSYHGISFFILFYLFNIKKLVVLFKQVSDFKTFGMPRNFYENIRLMKKLAIGYYIYHLILVVGVGTSPLFFIKNCEEMNVQLNMTEPCGIAPTWLPFNLLDEFGIRMIVLIYQIYCCFFTNQISGFIAYCIWETIEHVVLRFEHVRETFVEALSEIDPQRRRYQFRRAVKYHQAVMGMGNLLNECFSLCSLLQFAMGAPIIGVCAYKVVTSFEIDAIVLFIGWSFTTFFVNYGGQKLMEMNDSIGFSIYSAPWYDFEESLKKDVCIVIMRCQKPTLLKAGGFGAMSFSTYLMIFKGAYSFTALLNTMFD